VKSADRTLDDWALATGKIPNRKSAIIAAMRAFIFNAPFQVAVGTAVLDAPTLHVLATGFGIPTFW
jgi:hypothetical protein